MKHQPRAAQRKRGPIDLSRLGIRAVAAAVAWMVAGAAAHAAAISVEEFVAMKPQWEKLAEEKSQLRIEGRYSSLTLNALRFRHCDLMFRAPEGRDFPRFSSRSKSVDVAGHLEKNMGELVFIIEHIRPSPDDLDAFDSRRALLPDDAAAAWYELAAWAGGRAKFYNDNELAARAADANLRGIHIEHRKLPDDDADGRLELAAKSARLQAPEALRQELVHEAYHVLWKKTESRNEPPIDELLNRLAEELPGSTVPLDPPQPELAAEYWKNPLGAYRKTGPNERTKLHRVFLSTLALRAIRAGAADDGSNGRSIAAAIDEQVPEFHALAEEFREREIEYRKSKIATATRQEAVELAELLRQRGKPELAQSVLEQWAEAKTTRARADGPAALLVAADDWLLLLDDEEKALALLTEAYEASEGSEEVARKIQSLGYVLRGGKWVPADEADEPPQDAVQLAMRAGRVIEGMTAEQVQKTLGQPRSVARAATAGRVNEIWTYGEPGVSRLAVHFQRTNRKGATGVVVKLSQIRP